MFAKLFAKLQALWNRLPHKVQAAIVVGASAGLTTLSKELDQLLSGNDAFTWLALRHDVAAAVMAGVVALKAFYMIPAGAGQQQIEEPTIVPGPLPANLPKFPGIDEPLK